jgi:uncharacterized protein YbaP (TraB family)
MPRFAWCGLLVAVSVLHAAHAQDASPPADKAVELETIAVTGTQPGPGLWKVSKGDHTLWILGTLSPLPRDIQWHSKELETRMAGAQEVLDGAAVYLKADTGLFGTLALLPSLIGVRNNPDGATLEGVVPPDLYARWVVLKRKYIGHSNRVERWRPIFAALELYAAALDRNHLTGADFVHQSVLKAAKRSHLTVTTPKVEVAIDNPRAAIKQFKADSMDDAECFRNTLDRIDIELSSMTARANAWATGDIEALRELPQSDGMAACAAAVSESRIARERGVSDLEARVAKVWLDAASAALERNSSTFAMVPMHHLLAANGYLSSLRVMGYTIEAPDEGSADAAAAASGTH